MSRQPWDILEIIINALNIISTFILWVCLYLVALGAKEVSVTEQNVFIRTLELVLMAVCISGGIYFVIKKIKALKKWN